MTMNWKANKSIIKSPGQRRFEAMMDVLDTQLPPLPPSVRAPQIQALQRLVEEGDVVVEYKYLNRASYDPEVLEILLANSGSIQIDYGILKRHLEFVFHKNIDSALLFLAYDINVNDRFWIRCKEITDAETDPKK